MSQEKNVEKISLKEPQPEKETEIKNQEEQEEQEELRDHPADRLMACFNEVEEQEKRLSNRRAGDLKYELTNNVYPIIRQVISAVLDFIDDIESVEITDEQEEELKKSMETAVNNCKMITEICDYIESNNIQLPEQMKNNARIVSDWAKKTIENSTQVNQ